MAGFAGRVDVTWDQVSDKLRHAGVLDEMLPGLGIAKDGAQSLHREPDRLVVCVTERGETEEIAEFRNEEDAIAFIYDQYVVYFALYGDMRTKLWSQDREAYPLPRAEDFGGRTLFPPTA